MAGVDGNSIYIATSRGLSESSMYIPMFDGPHIISQEECDEIEEELAREGEFEDYGLIELSMYNHDCTPGTEYYTWNSDINDDETFYEFDQMIDECMGLFVEEGDPTPWENFSDEYRLEWLERIYFLKSNNLSWHDPLR